MLTAADIIEFGLMTGPSNETASEGAARIVEALDRAGLLAPTPQIIRTPAELEALDPDTALLDDGTVVFVEEVVGNKYWKVAFPAVVVASGERVRACREALEGETT